jgi:hypothetical protein
MIQLYVKEIPMLTENINQFMAETDKMENVPVGAVNALLCSITNFGVTLLAYLESKREEAITANDDTPAWEVAEDAVSVGYWNGRCDAFNELIGMLAPLNEDLPGN